MQPNEGFSHVTHRLKRRADIQKRRQENREKHKEMKTERDKYTNTRLKDIEELEGQLSLELENDI